MRFGRSRFIMSRMSSGMGERVVLAMSGGVDSSAAAVLLHQQGYEVIGLFMRSGESAPACALPSEQLLPVMNTRPNRQGCCSADDAADARRVADRLGIPFHSLDFQDGFRRIKDYFADEYLAGRTPNPCVQCNNWLKFGRLWDFARQVGAQKIATGHYAQLQDTIDPTAPALLRGSDRNKDQSYVLFGIRRQLLSSVMFPLGGYEKPEIRKLAADSGLRVADKKDSYEICFVPDNDYAGFLKRHREFSGTSGNFTDLEGNILGTHDGFERFTVGQRKGLGIAFGEPRFVIRIVPETCDVVLGKREDLQVSTFQAVELNWLADPPDQDHEILVQVRYRHDAVPCRIDSSVADCGSVIVTPEQPVYGVAPGQAAVFYRGTRVLGGGWIRSAAVL